MLRSWDPEMKNIILVILLVVLCGEILYLVKIKGAKAGSKVLSVKIENSPTGTPTITLTPTPLQTPTPTITASPSPKPTIKPTPTPVPQPVFTSQQIYEFIERFSGQYAVDNDVIRYIAICESGFKQFATNGKYSGLFQFDSTTWKNIRKKMGEDPSPDLRLNAEEAVQTASFVVSIGRSGMWPNCMP
jgi:hypothetical protein